MSESEQIEAILRDTRNVSAELDAIRAEVEALKGDIEQGQRELMEAKGELKNQLEHVEGTMARLTDEMQHVEAGIDAAMSQVSGVVASADAIFSTIEGEVTTLGAQLQDAVLQVATAIQQCDQTATQLAEEAAATAQAGAQTFSTGIADFREMFEGQTQQTINDLDGALNQQRAALARAVGETDRELSHASDALDSFLEKTLVRAQEHFAEEFGETLKSFGSENVEQVWNQFRRDVKGKLKEEVQEVIDTLVDHVLEGIDSIERKMEEAMFENSDKRRALEPIYNQIDRLIDPVERTVDGVKSICSAVGFSV